MLEPFQEPIVDHVVDLGAGEAEDGDSRLPLELDGVFDEFAEMFDDFDVDRATVDQRRRGQEVGEADRLTLADGDGVVQRVAVSVSWRRPVGCLGPEPNTGRDDWLLPPSAPPFPRRA